MNDRMLSWDERDDYKGKPLSPRQIQILQLMADGNNARQIGDILGIHHMTVKNHKHVMYKKLDAFDAPNAVAIGIREGIIK